MGLLDWRNPTHSWPAVPGPAPDPSWQSLQLPSLPFGSRLESARFLGRPDEFRGSAGGTCELLYAQKGLRLRFTGGRLSEVAYLLGASAGGHPLFRPAEPMAPDGTRLTSDAGRSRIVELFGEPDPGGSDERTLQVFHQLGVASDFDLDDRGRLVEWAFYPSD